MMRPVGQTTDAEAPILLASKAKPTSMSSGIATVMKDQTSDRLKQSSILQVLLTLAQS